jgi:hypothetical protein
MLGRGGGGGRLGAQVRPPKKGAKGGRGLGRVEVEFRAYHMEKGASRVGGCVSMYKFHITTFLQNDSTWFYQCYGSGIRDPGWVKNQDPDPGSGINIMGHISESSETISLVKNT